REHLLDERADRGGRRHALRLARQDRRLTLAPERVVAALRVPVIRDDDEVAALVRELTSERLAAGVEGRVRRVDAAGAELELSRAAVVHDGVRRRRSSAWT